MNLETHKIGRFDVRGEWAPELLPPLCELLERYETYLPGWCQIAYVRYVNELAEDGTVANCQLHFEYRNLVLGIGSLFFGLSMEERAERLVHEIVHASQSTIFGTMLDLLREAIGDNELAMSYAEKQLRESVEGTVCDLTALLMRVEKTAKDGRENPSTVDNPNPKELK